MISLLILTWFFFCEKHEFLPSLLYFESENRCINQICKNISKLTNIFFYFRFPTLLMNISLSPLHAHLSSTCLSQAQVLLAGNVKFRFLVVIQACFQGCKILPNDNNQSLLSGGGSEQWLEVPLLGWWQLWNFIVWQVKFNRFLHPNEHYQRIF